MTQQEAEVILKVNDQQAREKLEKLEAQASDLRAKFADAFKRGDTRAISEVNQKLQKVNKEINNMRTNAANIRAAMVRLNEASPRDLQRTIKMINNELNSGRVKRGTKEWDDYVEKLKEVQAELKKVKEEMAPDDDDDSIFDKIKDGINDWGATAAAAMGAFAGVVMSGKAAVQAFADMEAEEANVRKFTGMTADEVARLNDEFKKLDTRTSREDLNKLAQEAGRLGKTSVADVLGFVKAADQINVALDDLGDGATLTLSKLTGIFGDEARFGTEQSLLKVGSVINELSQNCSASAPYLAEFSSRLGGIAAQSKMTISQVMAFAAVLDTQNLAVEASATAVGQLITKIYQEPAKIAKATGLEVEKFSKMVKTDMNGALIMLFDHLNKFGGMENLASVFDAMGTDGARAIPVLSALAGHIEELKWQQDEANKAFIEGISVTNEFSVQNNTVEAQLDKARKGFTEMAVTLGQQLLPVMRYCISGTSMLMRVMSTLVDFFIKHRTSIITLTAAFAAYNVVMAVYNARVKIATAWTTALAAVQTKFHGVIVVGKLLYAALANSIQYVTNGLEVNMTMQMRWRTAMSNMKFAHWTGLIIALGAAIYAGMQRIKGIDEETRKFNKSMRDAVASASRFDKETLEEKKTLDKLFGALDAAREGSDEYNKAKQDLINTYGDYVSDLIDEHGRITNLATAYDRLAESIRLANIERGVKNSKDAIENNYFERLNDLTSKLNQTLLDYGVSIREASSITAKVTTALNLGIDLDQATKDRINEIARSGRQAVDGNSGRGTKLVYNGSAALYTLTGGLLGSDFADDPAAIVNKMIDAFTQKEQALHDVDRMAADQNPLRNITDDYLKNMIDLADAASKEGGSILKVVDGLTGQFEYVTVSAKEAADYLSQLTSEKYRRSGGIQPEISSTQETIIPNLPESDKERRERERKEREAARQAREALKKDLDERKAAYLQAEAENLTMYVTGEKNYADYCTERERLEREYVEDVVQIHLDHNKLDIAAYGNALKEKAQLQKRQQDAERKRSLAELEKDHSETENQLVKAFWDADSPDFQNAKLLNQMLFQEDQRYLEEKAKLYLEGSEERAAIEREIANKLAQDQLDKQKETAQAYMAFEEKYRKASGSRREQMEIEMLNELKRQKLITEAEYQKALADLRNKYLKMDKEKEYQHQSEMGDIFSKFFYMISGEWEKITDKELSNLDKIAIAAQTTYALMGSMLSQYSSYVNAERDLELAKIEKRYDQEIKAAGKNEKKKKKLEEQKEAEVAKVKKKYNDKAMKIELAQAIAQTAVAAIAAYASASKVAWWLGPVAAAMATAAGALQIATIKKQHEAEAAGYYEGGFTSRDPNNRKEVGVVHANEFVANHDAVANPALAPVLRLIDHAQRNNTVGSLTAADVSQAIGTMPRVGAGGSADYSPMTDALTGSVALMADITAATRVSLDRLSDNLENGIESFMVMDGPNGFDRRYEHYKKLKQNPKR